jgi:DNA mismatch repair ATPase MutS
MKVHLMNPDADFDASAPEPAGSADLAQDLELDYLWDVMGGGDPLRRAVARAAFLQTDQSCEVIRYRQQALADVLRNESALEALYELTARALAAEHEGYLSIFNRRPDPLLHHAVRVLSALADIIDELRRWAASAAPGFSSPAFVAFFETLRTQLDDDYMHELRGRLKQLEFPGGLLMSARLGPAAQVTGWVLRRPRPENRRMLSRVALKRPLYSYTIPDRDEAGHNALAELRDRSLNDVANAASQAVDHVLAFFSAMRTELAFYLGCVRLEHTLRELGGSLATPDPAEPERSLTATGLYDASLAIRAGTAPVASDVDLAGGDVLIVTGANHGGKTTFLRALGVAQLMMQAGMFVTAVRFTAPLSGAVHTHWAREEDVGLEHGKLDEELARMSTIVDRIHPGDLLLCNESFSSTNEAEGSEIALELTRALSAANVQLRYVTHLYDFAHELERTASPMAVFLRAPRDDTGTRSYQLEPGPPLSTSYGVEVFDRVFGTDHRHANAPTAW